MIGASEGIIGRILGEHAGVIGLMLSFDGDGNIAQANGALLKMLDFSDEDLAEGNINLLGVGQSGEKNNGTRERDGREPCQIHPPFEIRSGLGIHAPERGIRRASHVWPSGRKFRPSEPAAPET